MELHSDCMNSGRDRLSQVSDKTRKRSNSPTGSTPYPDSKKVVLEEGKRIKWTQTEINYLNIWAKDGMSAQQWRNLADDMNIKFPEFTRTGASCRLFYNRLKRGETVSKSSNIKTQTEVNENITCDKGTQTEEMEKNTCDKGTQTEEMEKNTCYKGTQTWPEIPISRNDKNEPLTSTHVPMTESNRKKLHQKVDHFSANGFDHIYSSASLPVSQSENPHVVSDHGYSKETYFDHGISEKKESAVEYLQDLQCNIDSTIDMSMQKISTFGKSILFMKDPRQLCELDWFREVVKEMNENCPELLRVLFSAVGDKISAESKLATISTIYGMILHCRNVKACAIQRIYSSLCIRYHADNKLLERLNKIHVTLSHETKRNIMNDFAEYSNEKIIEQIAEGKDGKINGDNLDLYVTTNDIRIQNKNKDYHFFASDITFDRVKLQDKDDLHPLADTENITYKSFIPSEEEDVKYKQSLGILLQRILSDHIDEFQWMKTVTPKHIPHNLEDVMSSRSEVHWLPVQLKNETCYSDCVQILNEYQRQIAFWYTKAGRAHELDTLKIPIGGDQLTRVRLQGAKALQAGSLTIKDRLDTLEPIIVEMFHTLMDLLEKLYKRFYNISSGREKGTLYSLKVLIQRSNVNGKVKTRYEAHEDFVMTAGCGYFLSFIMEHFNMKKLEDKPTHPLLKTNMKMLHNQQKEKICTALMDEIVDKLVQTYPKKDQDVMLTVEILGHQILVRSAVDGPFLRFELNINNENCIFNVTKDQAEKGAVVNFNSSTCNFPVKISVKDEIDDLNSYVLQFLQWYFLILSFKDAVKEGDIFRNNINLKFCIPIFFSHSVLSKYLEECIDYILKTEIILTEKMSLKVRCGSFVNLSGKRGDNKAADLQKENEVLVLKELIRGLGANKTEKAIVTVTKAAPVIQCIVNNFDKMLNMYDKKTHHKKRAVTEDVKCIINQLLPLKIWTRKGGRHLDNFHKISLSPFPSNIIHFKEIIMNKVCRLKRGIAVPDDSSDEESESDS